MGKKVNMGRNAPEVMVNISTPINIGYEDPLPSPVNLIFDYKFKYK